MSGKGFFKQFLPVCLIIIGGEMTGVALTIKTEASPPVAVAGFILLGLGIAASNIVWASHDG